MFVLLAELDIKKKHRERERKKQFKILFILGFLNVTLIIHDICLLLK